MKIRRVGILYHPLVEATRAKASDVSRCLESNGVATWRESSWETAKARGGLDNTDLIITIGGDGTILRAAQVVLGTPIPIVGVNLGTLGFMTELSAEDAIEKLPHLLAGEGWIDERAMLMAEVPVSGGKTGVFHALNDVVIARGAIPRIITIEVNIDSSRLTSYRTDGIIMATATGSTGYCLAAGGPILYPQSRDFALVPIAPHLGLRYPLVLAGTSTVTLHVTTFHEATVCIDGHNNVPLTGGSTVIVKQSPNRVRFLRLQQPVFYSSLEQKLKGIRQSEPNRKS